MTSKTGSIVTVGRRKTAVARLKIMKHGDEKLTITVNGKDFKVYFPYFELQDLVLQPLKLVGQDKLQIAVKVSGGGPKGQAEAVRHALSRAMLKFNEEFRSSLRKNGLLTRDSRRKERKKPGLKRARRAPQWSKR